MSLFAALTYPFAAGLAAAPAGGRCAYLRADADPGLREGWARELLCVQSFKPAYDRLRALGATVEPEMTGGDHALILLALTKHKLENQAAIAQAWDALAPNGRLVIAGATDAGGAALTKQLAKLLPDAVVWSKHHCKILLLRRAPDAATPPIFETWRRDGARQIAPATGYWSQPGLYNWNKIDAGSALLARCLPDGLRGRAADFGAGWGYLALRLTERCSGLAALDLYEAEARAEPCARANLAALPGGAPPYRFDWRDLAADPPAGAGYQLIVMNPPFHDGKAADIELGRRFIAGAASALAPGGRLLMVANRHLPYEERIDALLRRRRLVVEADGFKVIEAWRD